MNKKLKYGLLSVVLIAASAFSIKSYYSVMGEALKMQKFRSSHDPKSVMDHKVKFDTPFNAEGIKDMHASGSNRPLFADLRKRLSHVKGKIYVVDLTGGSQPYLYGKYPEDSLGYTDRRKDKFDHKLRRFIIFGGFTPADPKEYVSEEVAAHNNGFEYVKFFNTRGKPPTSDIIDSIVHLVETMGEDDWLHFHCLGGKGRTTVALTLVDILKNGKKLPLETIVDRQHRMGGVNLYDLTVWKRSSYTVEGLTNRKMLIVNFYNYVNATDGYGKTSWSEWAKRHNVSGMVNVD